MVLNILVSGHNLLLEIKENENELSGKDSLEFTNISNLFLLGTTLEYISSLWKLSGSK